MSRDALLHYLEQYVAGPTVLSWDRLSADARSVVPAEWGDILSQRPTDRRQKALDYWSEFAVELTQVHEYLRRKLVSIDLVHHGLGHCLVYGIESADGSDLLYYESRNPKTQTVKAPVAAIWNKLPARLRRFYEFHNGWYDLTSTSLGPSPVESFFLLDSEDWGILEEIGRPPVDLAKTLAVYTNGMGGYVCLTVGDQPVSSVLWWSNKRPRLDIDFWPVVDEWTVLGLEG